LSFIEVYKGCYRFRGALDEGGDREQDAGFPHSNEPEESMKVEPSDMDPDEGGS